MSVGQKLKEVRKHFKLKQQEFAKELGIPDRTYWGYEKGVIDASLICLQNVNKKFNVNLNWLIVGEGEMFITKD